MNQDNNNLNGTVLGSVGNQEPVSTEPTNLGQMPNMNTNMNNGVSPNVNVQNNMGVTNNNPVMPNNPVPNNDPVGVQNNGQIGVPLGESMQQPQEVVTPPPAYTNPQTINPAPMNQMPGFENPANIGTTPPISLEPEKKPKKKGNKVLFVILILIVLVGVGFGTYYVLNYTDLLSKKEQVTIETKDIEVSINGTLPTSITEYATINGTDTKNCSLNTLNVVINKEGEYEYTVTCGEISKTGKVKVIDNTELEVATKTVYKTKEDKVEPKEFIDNKDNLDMTYEFVEPDKVNALLSGEYGTYTVKIKVKSNNKTTEVDGTLVLMEQKVKGFYICSSKEQNVEGINAKMTLSEEFVILNDGNHSYGNIANETYLFTFTDETEYTSYLAKYKTEEVFSINNISGKPVFDDEKLTISITRGKDNLEVINEYGENNMLNYSTIKTYFVNTLGYTCVYKNAE